MSESDATSLSALVADLTARLEKAECRLAGMARLEERNKGLAERIEQLTADNERLAARNEELEGRVRVLEAENANLRSRLGTDSSNSSKPPSSDGPAARARSLRQSSGRKPGGQAGHEGTTLRRVDLPDRVIVHAPQACDACGRGLLGVQPVGPVVRRQVFDIPLPAICVTEHQMVQVRCPACHQVTRASAPQGVDAPAQYGPRIAAVGLYLYQGQFLSKDRTAQALAELLGTAVSAETVVSWTARAAGSLESFTAQVADQLAAGDLLHVDETSIRHPNGRVWIHSASNERFSVFTAHPKRGRVAMDEAGVLPRFRGVLVSDAFAVYDQYTDVSQHVLCNAHLLRELQAVTDHHQAGSNPNGWCWATQITDALLALKHAADTGVVDPALLATHCAHIHAAAVIGAGDKTEGKLALHS